MKDDLTDARMELDYAYCAKEDGEAELAKYFGTAASERLNKSFKETHALFQNYAQQETDFEKESVSMCLWDEIHQEMEDEYEYLLITFNKDKVRASLFFSLIHFLASLLLANRTSSPVILQ